MNEIVNNASNLFEPEYVDGAPSSPPEYVILLSMDRAYFHKFARRMLLSLQQKMADDDWMVHVHVVNPDQECLQAADELRQAEVPLVMSWDYPLLPKQMASETETIEHRTLYACRRIQLWPWALENYKCPVWIVDCDMEAVRPLPAVDMGTDAGFIRFSSALMPLYQEFFLSSGYIRPTHEGIRFARAMAAYIQHYLDQRLWVWSLDQVAIYCVSAWLEEIGLPFRYFPLSPSMIYTKNWSESHAEASSPDDQRVVFVNQVGSSDVSARRARII
ncbi:MAG: hypothetical protein HY885_15285 [Deltaproteobacteria bacterium]|nr:hypothetical protein [Deltaproteobacteria bacterium]